MRGMRMWMRRVLQAKRNKDGTSPKIAGGMRYTCARYMRAVVQYIFYLAYQKSTLRGAIVLA